MIDFKKVNQQEFHQFLSDYKNTLVVDICGISEPPLKSYNDFSNSVKWPESMVAKIKMEDRGQPAEYFIKI